MSGGPAPATAPRSELGLRVVSGLVLAGIALATAWTGDWPFGLLWTVAAIVGLREFLRLVGLEGLRLTIGFLAGGATIAAAAWLAEISPAADARSLALVVAGAAVAAVAAPAGRRAWAALAVACAAIVAVVPVDVRGHPAHGLVAILWLFAVVWGSDIAAYFTGRALGGPKLWPAVSPKKTWSGAIGGLVGGSAAAVAVVQVARGGYGLGWYSGVGLVALTVVASIVSIGGDLAESALKRRFQVKDSGALIPGHGGVMDRLDSFWAVCLLLGLLLYAFGGPG